MLDFIFRRNNPTNTWTRRANLSLSADLSNWSINGVVSGSHFELLSDFGRSDKGNNSLIEYRDLGMSFDLEADQTFSGYSLVFSDEENRFKPYAGEIKIDGVSVSSQAIVPALGEPYCSDTDEDETLQIFEFGAHEIVCELTLDGKLKRLNLTNYPMMADPQQRASYGVTKPWPGS